MAKMVVLTGADFSSVRTTIELERELHSNLSDLYADTLTLYAGMTALVSEML